MYQRWVRESADCGKLPISVDIRIVVHGAVTVYTISNCAKVECNKTEGMFIGLPKLGAYGMSNILTN